MLEVIAPITDLVFASTCTTAFSCGHPVRLPCGYFITPIHCRGSIGVGFRIHAANGSELCPPFSIATDTCTTFPEVLPLIGGNFSLIWHTSATMKCATFTQFGVMIGSILTLSTSVVTSGKVPWHSACALIGGNFHLGWATSSAFLGQIINGSTGALVGSNISIDSFGNGGFHIATPCANGDFLVGCYDPTATKHKIYRITAAGSITWGPQMPCAGTTYFAQPDLGLVHPPKNRLFELNSNPGTPAQNNFVWMLPDTDTYSKAHVCSYLGALVKKVDIGASYHDAAVANPICITPAGFCIGHALNAQPNTYGSFFDFNGNCLQQNVVLDTTAPSLASGQTGVVNIYLDWSGSSVVFSRYFNNGATVHNQLSFSDAVGVKNTHFNGTYVSTVFGSPPSNGVLPPGAINIQWSRSGGQSFGVSQGGMNWAVSYDLPVGIIVQQPQTASDMSCPAPCCGGGDGVIFTSYFSVGTLQLIVGCQKIDKSSVFGVAAAAAANGGAVTINSAGYFQLPSTQYFPIGNSFDRRASLPWGCRGTVGGASAVLAGWV